MPDMAPLTLLGAVAVAADAASSSKAGIAGLLHQQRQEQSADGLIPNGDHAGGGATMSDDAPASSGSAAGSGNVSVASSPRSSPVAGPLARSLNIPMFAHANGAGSGPSPRSSPRTSPHHHPHKHQHAHAHAHSSPGDSAAPGAVGYSTPSKRSKFHNSSAQSSPLLAAAMMGGSVAGLPPSVVLSPPDATPIHSPSRSMSMSAAGHQPGPNGHHQTSMSFMQGAHQTGGGNGSGSGKNRFSPSLGPSSVQKRRNSGTPALHLSPSPSSMASPGHAPGSGSNGLSNSARKPPTYPSNPNTPSMLGRSLPINIGASAGGSHNSSRRGSYSHSAGGLLAVPSSLHGGGGGGAQGPSLTPPGTPQVLPIPRNMLPSSPLTPALGPNHTIAVTTASGVQRVGVSPRQLNQYMQNDISQMALPPQAAPHHQQQHGHHGHRQHHHQHHQQQQQQQHEHRQHDAAQSGVPSPSAKSQARPASASSPSQQPQQARTQAPSPTQQQQQQQTAQASAQQSSPRVQAQAQAQTPVFNTVTPVKHLVKLSSLSSLSTLIVAAPPASAAAAAAAGGATPGSVPAGASLSSPRSSPESPPTASPVSSPSASPSPSSRPSASPSLCAPPRPAPVLLPAPMVVPPTYIILDIDETIHINAHAPCLMMCEKGLEMYQRIISSHSNYKAVSYQAKSALTRTLQAALQSKRTVEEHTGALLNSLQAANDAAHGGNNIKIFGLTARFSHMASTTRKELLKLGIDLEKSSPFPMSVRKRMAQANGKGGAGASSSAQPSPSSSRDRSLTPSPVLAPSSSSSPLMGPLSLSPSSAPSPYYPDVEWHDHPSYGTEAKYQSGVIYTNASCKGPVLSRFLEFLWDEIEKDNHEVVAANAATIAAHQAAMAEHQAAHEAAIAAAAAASASDAGHQAQSSPTSSRSLDDLAGQLACAGGATLSPMPADAEPSSHSLMRIERTASNPIPIGNGGSNSAAAPPSSAQSPSATPSPSDSTTMSLLTAASQMAQRRGAPNLGCAAPLHPHGRSGNGNGKGRSPVQSPLSASSVQSSGDRVDSWRGVGYPSLDAAPLSLLPVTLLPSRLIFIDDRLQNCASVYESLSSAGLFDAYYNHLPKRRLLGHVPANLEVFTCHYAPPELAALHAPPTNQTRVDAAASAAAAAAAAAAATSEDAAPDLELIEAQIHHFLTHGEILNDSRGRALLQQLREKEAQIKQRVKEAEELAQRTAAEAQQVQQASASQQQAQQAQLLSTPIDVTVAADGSLVRQQTDSSSSVSSAASGASCSAGSGSAIMMEDCSAGEESQPHTPPSPAVGPVAAVAVAPTVTVATATADVSMLPSPSPRHEVGALA